MSRRSRIPVVVAAILVVVTVAAVLAIVLRRNSDDDAGSATTTVSPTAAAVTVEGAPLPEYQGDPDPAVGTVAPTLIGSTYDGTPMEIVPGEGGPMMIVFLAHWCPHCNDEVPVLLEWRDSGGIPADLQVLGVSTAVDPARPNFPPAEWLANVGWDWPMMADGPQFSAFEAYGGSAFPYFVVLGADGTVRARNVGELPIEELNALVQAALA